MHLSALTKLLYSKLNMLHHNVSNDVVSTSTSQITGPSRSVSSSCLVFLSLKDHKKTHNLLQGCRFRSHLPRIFPEFAFFHVFTFDIMLFL